MNIEKLIQHLSSSFENKHISRYKVEMYLSDLVSQKRSFTFMNWHKCICVFF
jgi:hypothetical protein